MHGKFPKQYFTTAQPPAAPPPPEPVYIGWLSSPASSTRPRAAPAEQHALAGHPPCSGPAPQLAEGTALAAPESLPQQPEQDVHQFGQAAGSPGNLAGRKELAECSGSSWGSSSASEPSAAGDATMAAAATSGRHHAAVAVLATAQLDVPAGEQRHLCATAVRTPDARAARPEAAYAAQGGCESAPHSATRAMQQSARRRPTAYSAFSAVSIRQPCPADLEQPKCSAAAAAAAKPQATLQLPSDEAAPGIPHGLPDDRCAEPAAEPLRLLRLQELARPACQQADVALVTCQPACGGQSAVDSHSGSHAASAQAAGAPASIAHIGCSEVSTGTAASSGTAECSSGGAESSRASSNSTSSGAGARCKDAVAQQEALAAAHRSDANASNPSGSGSRVRRGQQQVRNSGDARSAASMSRAGCSGSRSSGASARSATDVLLHETNAAGDASKPAAVTAWTPRLSTNRPTAKPARGAGSAVSQPLQQLAMLAPQLPAVGACHRNTRQRMKLARQAPCQASASLPVPANVQLQQPAAAKQSQRQVVPAITPGRRTQQSAAASATGRKQPQRLPSSAEAACPLAVPNSGTAAGRELQPRQLDSQMELPGQPAAAAAVSQQSGPPQRSTPKKARHPAAAVAGGAPTRSSAPGYATMAAARRQPAGSPVAARRQSAAAKSVFVQHVGAPAREPLEHVTLQRQPAAPGVIMLPMSATAQVPGSAVQLLAACGADAKLAAAAAAASTPIVGAHIKLRPLEMPGWSGSDVTLQAAWQSTVVDTRQPSACDREQMENVLQHQWTLAAGYTGSLTSACAQAWSGRCSRRPQRPSAARHRLEVQS